jgi:Type II secretion system (T2SS), protein K
LTVSPVNNFGLNRAGDQTDPHGFIVSKRTTTQEQGFILIIVIWLMAFFSLVAITVTRSVQAHIRQTANHVQARHAELLADAGVTLATLDLTKAKIRPRRFPSDGSPIRCTLDDATLTISVQDAGGRISLNTGSERLLQALFLGLGSTVETANRATDVIIDFRDSDDLRRVNGAEKPDYLATGRTLGPKNEPFDAVEELHQVLGLDAQLISAIKPHVTAHSVTAGLDPRVTSAALAGLISRGAEKLPNPSTTDLGAALPAEFMIGSPQRVYYITVQAEVPGSTVYVRDAIVELAPGNGLPNIKSWKRGYRLNSVTPDSPTPPPNC